MLEVDQYGSSRRQNYRVIDTEKDVKLFDIRLQNGELVFRNKYGVIIWCIRYNNTALLINIEDKSKQKAYFEVYHYTNGMEELIAKIDYMPNNSDFLGIKYKPSDDEEFIYRKNDRMYGIVDSMGEIITLVKRDGKELAHLSINSYDEESIEKHMVMYLVADSIWNVHRFEQYKIDYKTNLIKLKPKTPRMFAFKKANKELFEGNDERTEGN